MSTGFEGKTEVREGLRLRERGGLVQAVSAEGTSACLVYYLRDPHPPKKKGTMEERPGFGLRKRPF